ncbi:hypothetical protein FACS1894202_09810 [Clostridia bacterium]|nr:hypothetical protein FACS1894202_09810 [Clostridia bacterium]
MGVTIDDKALNKLIARATKAAPRETTRAVMDCTLALAGESARRAPVDVGDLRNNCHAKVNEQTVFENQERVGGAAKPSVTPVGTVGYSLPYALRQHEELDYKHPKGGEAKYLEKPFNELLPRFQARFQQVIKEALKQ